jgi:hypothetical protein
MDQSDERLLTRCREGRMCSFDEEDISSFLDVLSFLRLLLVMGYTCIKSK